jgi:hypothetical protein
MFPKLKYTAKKTFPKQTLPRPKKIRNKLFHVENHIKNRLPVNKTDLAHIQTEEFDEGFADENKADYTYPYTGNPC